MFNNEITTTGFGEGEVVLFFRICEINKAIEISANKPAISPSKILNATEFDGVLKFSNDFLTTSLKYFRHIVMCQCVYDIKKVGKFQPPF